MLTIGLSTLLFLAFAGLGNLLLIMNETAYMLVPLYAGYFEWRQELFDFTTFWYLYLTTFIAFMLYADSIRFKSLM